MLALIESFMLLLFLLLLLLMLLILLMIKLFLEMFVMSLRYSSPLKAAESGDSEAVLLLLVNELVLRIAAAEVGAPLLLLFLVLPLALTRISLLPSSLKSSTEIEGVSE